MMGIAMSHYRLSAALLAMAIPILGGHASAQYPRWTPAWGSAQMLADGKDADAIDAAGPVTIRQIVRLTAGGRALRVRLSNVAGDRPMSIGAASIAADAIPGRADVPLPLRLTFAGAAAVTIPPGAELYSDPVAINARVGGDVAVSLFVPTPIARFTGHPGARATTFIARGDQTGSPSLAAPRTIGGWWGLADVEVADSPQTATVVAIGDSITDGHGIADNTNARWPDLLARRFAANPATRALSVVNAGIGGNRVLLDGLGPNLLARFGRDVVERPRVRAAIVLEGVNDLGVLTRDGPATVAQHLAMVAAITGAYRQMAARAHAHGIRLIGATITPYAGNDYYHPGPQSEADRQAINRFIRSSGTFDGVVDFDAAVRDPARPDHLLPAADSGDHLHPGPVGYRMMAEAVPLSLFAAAPPSSPARPATRPAAAVRRRR